MTTNTTHTNRKKLAEAMSHAEHQIRTLRRLLLGPPALVSSPYIDKQIYATRQALTRAIADLDRWQNDPDAFTVKPPF